MLWDRGGRGARGARRRSAACPRARKTLLCLVLATTSGASLPCRRAGGYPRGLRCPAEASLQGTGITAGHCRGAASGSREPTRQQAVQAPTCCPAVHANQVMNWPLGAGRRLAAAVRRGDGSGGAAGKVTTSRAGSLPRAPEALSAPLQACPLPQLTRGHASGSAGSDAGQRTAAAHLSRAISARSALSRHSTRGSVAASSPSARSSCRAGKRASCIQRWCGAPACGAPHRGPGEPVQAGRRGAR